MTRSGAPASTLSTCKYFHVMEFLHERSANKPTESNVDLSVYCGNTQDGLSEETALLAAEPVLPSPIMSSTVTNCSSNSMLQTPLSQKSQKRKSPSTKECPEDSRFLAQLKSLDDRVLNSFEKNEVCEMTSFCNSLIPRMKGLPPRKRSLARLKIEQILFEIEYGSVDTDST